MRGVLTTGLGVEGLPIVVEIPFIDERRTRTTGSRSCTMKRRGAAFVDCLVRPCPYRRRNIAHRHGRGGNPRGPIAIGDPQRHLEDARLLELMSDIGTAGLGMERCAIVIEIPF